MDKDSVIELQKLDCNCNNCIFMQRDMDKYKDSEILHYLWQIEYFATILTKRIDKAIEWIKNGEEEKGMQVFKQAANMRFQYTNTAFINYGQCKKFEKAVSFIPDTLQFETQECFEHRATTKKTTTSL